MLQKCFSDACVCSSTPVRTHVVICHSDGLQVGMPFGYCGGSNGLAHRPSDFVGSAFSGQSHAHQQYNGGGYEQPQQLMYDQRYNLYAPSPVPSGAQQFSARSSYGHHQQQESGHSWGGPLPTPMVCACVVCKI